MTRLDELGADSKALWVRPRRGVPNAWIVGEPHTFPGRFEIRTADGQLRSCSLYELGALSQESASWVSGYLHGSVPRPPEDDALMGEWRAKRAIFLRCGAWTGHSDYAAHPPYEFRAGDEITVISAPDGEAYLSEFIGALGTVEHLLELRSRDDQVHYSVWFAHEQESVDVSEAALRATGRRRKDYDDEPKRSCECCHFLTVPEALTTSVVCPVCGWPTDAPVPRSAVIHFVTHGTCGRNVARDSVRDPRPWEYPPPEIVKEPSM